MDTIGSSKTIISFDIGIKNLAYCVFKLDVANTSLQVLKWGIANLMCDHVQTIPIAICQQVGATKKGKAAPPCTKKATYTDVGGKCYCNAHAKKSGFTLGSLRLKQKTVADLKTFCTENGIYISLSDKRADILAKAEEWVKANSLTPIVVPKKTSANQVHLVEIGKQIRAQMDEILNGVAIDIVILENQISPIAGRMNTIQGMLAQYFIMSYPTASIPTIEFISSAGKLKGYANKTADSNTYKDHKRDSICYCQELMDANPSLSTYREVFLASSKKDDLADCFLQGIYFMKKEKYISCSEDLKINSVSL